MQEMPPTPADSVVVTAVRATIAGVCGVETTAADPGLKPYLHIFEG